MRALVVWCVALVVGCSTPTAGDFVLYRVALDENIPIEHEGTDAVGNLDSATLTILYGLENDGDGALVVDEVAVAPGGSCSVLDFIEGTIPAGGTASFRVSFDGAAVGPLDCSLAIQSNDPGTPEFTFDISATLLAPTLVTIDVTPAVGMVPVGIDLPYSAMGTYSDGTTMDVGSLAAWTTTDPSLATVSSTGVVTGLATGVTMVSASLDGITGMAPLTVTDAILTSIDVTPADTSAPLGRTPQFSALGHFSDGMAMDITAQATWSSTVPGVATIDTTGLCTTMAVGTTVIGASLDGVAGDTTFGVLAAVLETIELSPDGIGALVDLPIGLQAQFTATGTYSDQTQLDITSLATWTSAPSGRVAVDPAGLVTSPQSATTGAASVTASLDGIDASAPITVTDAVIVALDLQPSAWIVDDLGDTQQHTVTATWSDGTSAVVDDALIDFYSTDPVVASIGATGLATWNAYGTTAIGAETAPGTYYIKAEYTASFNGYPDADLYRESVAVPSGSVDYLGPLEVGAPGAYELEVRNSGNLPLTVSAIDTTTTNCTLDVMTTAPFTVPPGGATSIFYNITVPSPDAAACVLQITSDDPDETTYNFAATAVGTAPLGAWGDVDGTYAGLGTCSVPSVDIATGSQIDWYGFGANPSPTTYVLVTPPSVAQATGLTLFGLPDHTCTATRGRTDSIALACSNPGGGSCTDTLVRQAAPEIEVRYEALPPYQGELFAEGLAFSQHVPGFPSQTVRFTIRNTGTADLIISSVSAGFASNCTLSVSPPADSVLSPGESTSVSTSVTPLAGTSYTCTLLIANNDPTPIEALFAVHITGIEAFMSLPD